MALNGCITSPITHHSTDGVQQAAKDNTESNVGWNLKNWNKHLEQATWLVNTREPAIWAGAAQLKLQCTADGDNVLILHMKNVLGEDSPGQSGFRQSQTHPWDCFCPGAWVQLASDVGEVAEVCCVLQGNLILVNNSQWIK